MGLTEDLQTAMYEAFAETLSEELSGVIDKVVDELLTMPEGWRLCLVCAGVDGWYCTLCSADGDMVGAYGQPTARAAIEGAKVAALEKGCAG